MVEIWNTSRACPCPGFLLQEARIDHKNTLTFQSEASEDFFLEVRACLLFLLVQQSKA